MKIWPKKHFFEVWSWFNFTNLGPTLGTNLKFYTSVIKESKLNFKKFCTLSPMFVEGTGEKLLGGGGFLDTSPYWIGLNKYGKEVGPELIL